MLRARTLQERGNSYVCAFCRQKLSPRIGRLNDRSLSTAACPPPSIPALNHSRCPITKITSFRALSTSSSLSGPNDSNNPSKPGGFPGAGGFGGGFGAGVGGFGAFANKPAATTTKQTNVNELLPHELEARSRMGLNPKVSKPEKKATDPNTEQSSKKGKQNRQDRKAKKDEPKTDQAKAKPQSSLLTSTLLAEAFKTGRTSSGSRSKKQPTSNQSSEPDVKPAQVGWGMFSARRVDTAVPVQKPAAKEKTSPRQTTGTGNGDNSNVWGQLKRASRSHTREIKPNTGPDFWDNLETRVSEFRDRKQRDDTPTASRDESSSAPMPQEGLFERSEDVPVEQTKRNSRFEDEEDSIDSRRDKKSKRPKNSRRSNYDDDWDDEAVQRWESRQRRKAEKDAKKHAEEQAEQKQVQIFLPEYISVSDLARAMKLRVADFLNDLERMGFEDLTEDTIMTGDTAALVAMEYDLDPVIESGADLDLRPLPFPEDPSSLPPRPPVVTIMGHVDHGKTTLLDWLRKSSIAAQEHGGITQHIGAFVVQMSTGKQITFLDTPGHAAFLSMRQRGANVTDIVVLVVAADDSVMPQTIEALKHATAAKVPIIVAINKIDKEDARVEQVKADLARNGVEIEDYGGDVQVVPVSGKTGQGMEDLEENIVTLSEVLDVRAETDILAEGWILESSVKQIGKVASVLVKRGTLRLGDYIVAGKTWAKIRGLRNEAGVDIPEAPPGTPVEVLGWRDLPEAGEQVLQAPDEGKAKTAIEYRIEMAERMESSAQLAEQEQKQREKAAAEEAAAAAKAEGTVVAPTDTEPSVKYLNVIVKADVAGSVEAVASHIQEIGNNEVQTKVLRSSVGLISEYDVDHAATSNSVIVNFNNSIPPHIRQRAAENKVRIIDHSVIYHVADEVREALSALLPDMVTHRVIGEADVLQVFSINIKKRVTQNIAGCRVRNGAIKRSSMVKVLRGGEVVYDGKIDTLKHVKKDVAEMGKGTECGIGFEEFQDLQVDDQIQTYELIKESRHL